jgi:hypothetical protein
MESTLTLRPAGPGDKAEVARVAELDSRRPPTSPTMVAELDGRLVAAISLDDGAVVADPFEPTADIVHALRLRREQLSRPPRRVRATRASRLLRTGRPAVAPRA